MRPEDRDGFLGVGVLLGYRRRLASGFAPRYKWDEHVSLAHRKILVQPSFRRPPAVPSGWLILNMYIGSLSPLP